MRRRDRKVGRLLVQQEHVAMRRRLAGRRRGTEVGRRRGRGGFEHCGPVLDGRGRAWGVVLEQSVQDGGCAAALGTVDV